MYKRNNQVQHVVCLLFSLFSLSIFLILFADEDLLALIFPDLKTLVATPSKTYLTPLADLALASKKSIFKDLAS